MIRYLALLALVGVLTAVATYLIAELFVDFHFHVPVNFEEVWPYINDGV